MSNIIQIPALNLEMQLAEVVSLTDAMLYMHEVAEDAARKRIMDAETAMLFIIRDKVAVAMKSLATINRAAERRAG